MRDDVDSGDDKDRELRGEAGGDDGDTLDGVERDDEQPSSLNECATPGPLTQPPPKSSLIIGRFVVNLFP